MRLLVFVVGITLLTALMLPRAHGLRDSIIHACLAAVPAFAVLTVPKFARDFAWFGPQEPLLIGGLALGGALLALTARSLLSENPDPRSGDRRDGDRRVPLLAPRRVPEGGRTDVRFR